jgi:low temperature requirement protein LtrA
VSAVPLVSEPVGPSLNVLWHSLRHPLSFTAIVTSAMGDNQFKNWFIYFLLIFVAVTLITEIFYLNKV